MTQTQPTRSGQFVRDIRTGKLGIIHDTAGEDVLGWEMADCTCPPPSQPNFSTRRSQ